MDHTRPNFDHSAGSHNGEGAGVLRLSAGLDYVEVQYVKPDCEKGAESFTSKALAMVLYAQPIAKAPSPLISVVFG